MTFKSKFLACLFVLMFSPLAISAPFVIGDVISSVTACGVILDGAPKVVVPAGNLECRYDVGGVSNGAHSITMTAIITDPVWGNKESVNSVPLDFGRPGIPAAPGGLRLVP